MSINIRDKLSIPILIIIFLVILSIFVLTPILNMVILGIILSLGVRPIAGRINNKINSLTFSNIVGMFLITIPIFLIIFYLLFQIVEIISPLFASSGGISFFDANSLNNMFITYLPPQYEGLGHIISNNLFESSNAILKGVLDYAVTFLKNVPDIAISILILVFSTFYFARDGSQCWDYIFTFIPEGNQEFFDHMFNQIKEVLKSIFYGHFLTSVIIGIIAFIGYGILGYPYSVFLGILTGLFQLIPVLGPWPIYCILAIMDLCNGNYTRVVLVFIVGAVLSLSDMYIRPAIAGKYAELHPLILLLGFVAGPLVFRYSRFYFRSFNFRSCICSYKDIQGRKRIKIN
ncbi:AI-2E family transporter [uncultured Methanobrevibacter sp.]|uniref:AI-2E family transporter n=1 Tax=uncultured Methanobrevibacter sp. TaxID=253161 RepID=UPI0025F6ACA2|nr:AI-2E family transporter [uncultured Methanobrevibacter sp.]